MYLCEKFKVITSRGTFLPVSNSCFRSIPIPLALSVLSLFVAMHLALPRKAVNFVYSMPPGAKVLMYAHVSYGSSLRENNFFFSHDESSEVLLANVACFGPQ